MVVRMTYSFMYVTSLYFQLFGAVMPRILVSLKINSGMQFFFVIQKSSVLQVERSEFLSIGDPILLF